MYRLALAFLVCISLFISMGYAQDNWKHFYTNATGDSFYYDSAGIFFPPPPDTTGKVTIKVLNANEGATFNEWTQLVEMDCTKMSYRRLESKMIRKDGATITNHQITEWMIINPGSSYFEPVFDVVCKDYKLHKRLAR
jgi:hypothetical protein